MSLYSFLPAGHAPPARKRPVRAPNMTLEDVFKEWLDMADPGDTHTCFVHAFAFMQGMPRCTVARANALVLLHAAHKNIHIAGTFLSCLYNTYVDGNCITYDLDVPLAYLGYRLGKRKMLVNSGAAKNNLGDQARGVILNLGEAENSAARDLRGVFINCGVVKDRLGSDAKGLIINMGAAGYSAGDNATGKFYMPTPPQGWQNNVSHATPFDHLPGAKEYFLELEHQLWTSPQEFYERHRPIPAVEFRREIERRMR